MSLAVRLTELAVSDLAQAFQWYEEQKPDLGYRFMARVDEALDQIALNPALYAPVIGSAQRVLVEQFPYALYYTISEDAIVIACLHGKRDAQLARSRARNPNPS